MSSASRPDPEEPAAPGPIIVPDPRVRTTGLVRWGIILWVVALVVLLAVPPLRAEGREWWPWVPVAGVVLGLVGHVYLARGRGNARDA